MSSSIGPILENEAPVVYGSRFLTGRSRSPWMTVVANRTLTAIANLLYGSSLADMETCNRIMRADVAKSLRLELPVTFTARARAAGKKIRWHHGFQAIGVSLKYRCQMTPRR